MLRWGGLFFFFLGGVRGNEVLIIFNICIQGVLVWKHVSVWCVLGIEGDAGGLISEKDIRILLQKILLKKKVGVPTISKATNQSIFQQLIYNYQNVIVFLIFFPDFFINLAMMMV